MSKPNMREAMPKSAAFVDAMRQTFGKEMVDMQLKRSLRGESTFFAFENGHRLGALDTRPACSIGYDSHGISYVDVPNWVESARRIVRDRGQEIQPAQAGDEIDIEREVTQLRQLIAGGASVAAETQGRK